MFFSTIEALVFNKDPVEFEDSTMPDIEHQDAKIDPIVDEITEIFGQVWITNDWFNNVFFAYILYYIIATYNSFGYI